MRFESVWSRRDAILGGVVLVAVGLLGALGRVSRGRRRRVVPLSRAAIYRRHDLAG